MPKAITKAIMFDFDGVIHNTFQFHLNKIREYVDTDLTEEEYKDIHNGNFFIDKLEKLKNVNWTGYINFVHQAQSNLVMAKEIKEILLKLENKYQLFIVTSGSEKNISKYLENNKVLDLFAEVLGIEYSKMKVDKFNFIFDKYGLNSEECLFVTDTLGDVLEGNGAGIKTIALDSGFHERERLEKGKPFMIISELKELFDFL